LSELFYPKTNIDFLIDHYQGTRNSSKLLEVYCIVIGGISKYIHSNQRGLISWLNPSFLQVFHKLFSFSISL